MSTASRSAAPPSSTRRRWPALVSRISETADRPAPDDETSPDGPRTPGCDDVQAGARARAYTAAVARGRGRATPPTVPHADSPTPSGCATCRPCMPRPRPSRPGTTPRHTRQRGPASSARSARPGCSASTTRSSRPRRCVTRPGARRRGHWRPAPGRPRPPTSGREPGETDLPQALAESAAALQRAEALRPDAERLDEVRRLCDEVGALVDQVEVDLAAAVSPGGRAPPAAGSAASRPAHGGGGGGPAARRRRPGRAGPGTT